MRHEQHTVDEPRYVVAAAIWRGRRVRPDAQRQPGSQDAEGLGHEGHVFVAMIQAQWIWRSGVWSRGGPTVIQRELLLLLQTPGGATGIRHSMYMHELSCLYMQRSCLSRWWLVA